MLGEQLQPQVERRVDTWEGALARASERAQQWLQRARAYQRAYRMARAFRGLAG